MAADKSSVNQNIYTFRYTTSDGMCANAFSLQLQ